MPRFRTLSDAITSTIDAQVPKLNFPDGSVLNQQVGRIPFSQDTNYNKKDENFRWGFSTWGLETITTKYKPD
jgi:hypothetical protein